jgi:hypothetical protein
LTEQRRGRIVSMEEVHRVEESLEHEAENGQDEEDQAPGELANDSSSAAAIDELGDGMRLLQLDPKKAESTSLRVYRRRQRTGKVTGGNLVCTLTTHFDFCRYLQLQQGTLVPLLPFPSAR